jgi:hypothetical protein
MRLRGAAFYPDICPEVRVARAVTGCWSKTTDFGRKARALLSFHLGHFQGPAGLRRPMRREYPRSIAARVVTGLHMQKFCFVAAAVTMMSLQAGVALAQNAPASGAETTTAPAAGAAGSAAAPAATTTPPPADKPAATTTTVPADRPASTTTDTNTDKSTEPKKKKTATSSSKTNRKEIDRSIDTGTVPSRYKSQIPKEYHGYIPWSR